jgi:hypothetical protein
MNPNSISAEQILANYRFGCTKRGCNQAMLQIMSSPNTEQIRLYMLGRHNARTIKSSDPARYHHLAIAYCKQSGIILYPYHDIPEQLETLSFDLETNTNTLNKLGITLPPLDEVIITHLNTPVDTYSYSKLNQYLLQLNP